MPPLKCCKKTWSVGSDDFVLSSTVGVIFHTVWLGGLIAFALVVLVGRDCFPEGPRKNLVFTFIFSQIGLQALVIVSEGLVGLISSRGTISNPAPRRFLPHFLRLRAFLYAVEILGCAFGCYIAWSPYIQDHIDCERAGRVRLAIEAYVISVIVVLVVIAVLFMIYFDPLGLQTPSLLKELEVLFKQKDETDDDGDEGDDIVVNVTKVERKKGADKTVKVHKKQVTKRLYSVGAQRRWRRRIKTLCCCVGTNDRSKALAMEDIAHAMATMFDGVEIVPTDFMAALMLVHGNQRAQIKKDIKHDLGAQLKYITYQHMDESQFPPDYDPEQDEHTLGFELTDIRLLQDIRHYLRFALGIYGWPIHVYLNPLVGPLCLCANIKCRAFHRRAKDFVQDNCCLANTTAFQLRSKLINDNVICASYKNEVHWPPFSLCYDPAPRNAVVLSIRGSMSLRDALTDMHISMIDVKVDDEKYKDRVTKVHAGMYNAATNIKKEIDKKLKAVLMDKNYDFIITGHSLGAGVGAVLAVLYRKELPSHQKLHCYAFSPPGSLFTLPLVEYSKSFITTIVYGNDIVPRLTFRGLLYLKRNMTHLVDHCKMPKHAILCPKFFSCCYRHHRHVSHPGLQDKDIFDRSTEAGILKTPIDEYHEAEEGSSLHKFVEKMYTVEPTPAYIPGKVLYIRDTGKRIHRRFWNIIGEKEVYGVWMPNAEFSHIIVDAGIFDHHMPDTIQEVLDHLYQHHVELSGHKVAALNDPIKLDTTSDDDKENGIPTQPFHSNGVFSASSDYMADENEDTIKDGDVNRNTTEVIVHALPEGENEPLVVEEITTL